MHLDRCCNGKEIKIFYKNLISELFRFRVCEHVEDDIDLPMADLSDILKSDRPDEELIKDRKVIETLEEAVIVWERHISKVIDSYLAKVCIYIIYLDKIKEIIIKFVSDSCWKWTSSRIRVLAREGSGIQCHRRAAQKTYSGAYKRDFGVGQIPCYI